MEMQAPFDGLLVITIPSFSTIRIFPHLKYWNVPNVNEQRYARRDWLKKGHTSRSVSLVFLGAFHLGKKTGNFGGSKSGISDW